MSNNNQPLRCFLLPVLFLLKAILGAQTVEYAEFGSVQRLSWMADEYALRYEVLVEREEGNEYRRAAREFTDNSFIELSLPQGKYRYQVIPYDYLNRPAQGSEWKKIEVRAALIPELYYIVPEIFYIGDDGMHTLYISGKNIENDARFFLQGPGTAPIVPYTKQILADGSQAWLFFNDTQLVPGVYELHVRNLSGFETRGKALTVANPDERESEPERKPEHAETEDTAAAPADYRKPVQICLSAAWMPMLPIYGKNGLFFSNRLSFTGAMFRLDVIYHKPDFLNLGLELAASWYVFYPDINETSSLYYIAYANAATVTFSFLAQKHFPNQAMSLKFRLGAGITIPPDNGKPPLATDLYYPLLTMESFHTNMGASFLWYIQKHFYLELGMDYIHQFSEIPSACIRPWLGISFRF
jgi:hypothetical protein